MHNDTFAFHTNIWHFHSFFTTFLKFFLNCKTMLQIKLNLWNIFCCLMKFIKWFVYDFSFFHLWTPILLHQLVFDQCTLLNQQLSLFNHSQHSLFAHKNYRNVHCKILFYTNVIVFLGMQGAEIQIDLINTKLTYKKWRTFWTHHTFCHHT